MIFKLILSSVFLFNQVSWATQPISTEKAFKLISSFSNIEDILNYLKLDFTYREVQALEAYLVSQRINLNEKFSKAKINDNKILIGQDKFEITDDNAVLLNGLKFKYSTQLTLKQNFIMLQNITKPVSIFNIFVSEVRAGIFEGTLVLFIAFILALYTVGGVGSERSENSLVAACDEFGRFILINYKDQSSPTKTVIPDDEVKKITGTKFRPKCTRSSPELAEIQKALREIAKKDNEQALREKQKHAIKTKN